MFINDNDGEKKISSLIWKLKSNQKTKCISKWRCISKKPCHVILLYTSIDLTLYSGTSVSQTPVTRSFCISNIFFSHDHSHLHILNYIGDLKFEYVEFFFCPLRLRDTEVQLCKNRTW